MVNDRTAEQELRHHGVTIPLQTAKWLTFGAVLSGIAAFFLVFAAPTIAEADEFADRVYWWRPVTMIAGALAAMLLFIGQASQLRATAACFQLGERVRR